MHLRRWRPLGDHVARMSAVKYICDNLKHVDLYLYIPDFFVPVAKNLVPNIRIRGFSEKHKYDPKLTAIKTSCQQHDTLATHLTDHAFNVLVNKQVDIEHKNYCKLNTKKIDITKFKLPEKYVVVTTGFTANVREWPASSVNETVDYINSRGYTTLFLGSRAVPVNGMADNITGNFNNSIDYSKGIDLIDKTTLLEAGKIIAQSKCIIGVDNGLLHLAGTTDVPIIGGFTTVEGKYRFPYRNNQLGWNFYSVNPNESLGCRFCQSNWSLVYDHDFRNCWYNDRLCVSQMTSDKFIYHLKNIL